MSVCVAQRNDEGEDDSHATVAATAATHRWDEDAHDVRPGETVKHGDYSRGHCEVLDLGESWWWGWPLACPAEREV